MSDPYLQPDHLSAAVFKAISIRLEERAAHYLTDDVFMLFGDDFRYMNAFQNYQNMDAMIEYMNANFGDKYVL